MDFVGTAGGGGIGIGAGGGGGGLGSDNGPILYSEPNRTSAIDDLRSVVIYIFIITIILGFLLILPGVRSEKLPTFLCITTSIIVTSIILVVLFGTTWHVGQAPISGPYKAFSKDRIQGELQVKIGLRSVNITLRAHKYYELHQAQPVPVILEDQPPPPQPIVGGGTSSPTVSSTTPTTTLRSTQTQADRNTKPPVTRSKATSFLAPNVRPSTTTTTTSSTSRRPALDSAASLAEELLSDRISGERVENPPSTVDAEIEVDEVFDSSNSDDDSASPSASLRRARSSNNNNNNSGDSSDTSQLEKRSVADGQDSVSRKHKRNIVASNGQRYTIERSNVDINYNERFHWIEPDQMRQEHHRALERGLPYPILTVVEYLSQDEGGFSWSRQYRTAGYYSYIILWLSFCACILMFFLHCAAPKYGIYTMQAIGCLLLFTNFTYATLVPKGDRKLVIPFENHTISLEFGWSYWLVLIGGCLSLVVGTLIVIIDSLFPNFIFTTILDVDFDSHTRYYKHQKRQQQQQQKLDRDQLHSGNLHDPRPVKPPFLEHSSSKSSTKKLSIASSVASSSSSGSHASSSMDTAEVISEKGGSSTGSDVYSKPAMNRRRSSAIKLINTTSSSSSSSSTISNEVSNSGGHNNKMPTTKVSHLSELFVGPLIRRSTAANTFSPPITRHLTPTNSDSEMKRTQEGQLKRDSSVVEMLESNTSDTYLHRQQHQQQQPVRHHHKSHIHYHANAGIERASSSSANKTLKNNNLKTTDHQSRTRQTTGEAASSAVDRHVRL